MVLKHNFRIRCDECGNTIHGEGNFCDICKVFLHEGDCDQTHLFQHVTHFNTLEDTKEELAPLVKEFRERKNKK
jgi:hypothetical protein